MDHLTLLTWPPPLGNRLPPLPSPQIMYHLTLLTLTWHPPPPRLVMDHLIPWPCGQSKMTENITFPRPTCVVGNKGDTTLLWNWYGVSFRLWKISIFEKLWELNIRTMQETVKTVFFFWTVPLSWLPWYLRFVKSIKKLVTHTHW